MDSKQKTTYLEDVIVPGSWRGRRCFVVCGGPSLRGFDFTLLEGELTIGVNRAYEHFTPTINFSMDPEFFSWAEKGEFGQAAADRWDNGKFIHAFLETPGMPFPPDIARVRWDKTAKAPKTQMDEKGMYAGPNSGYGAIQIAAWLGSTEIYVLGLDAGPAVDGAIWHHSGYALSKTAGRSNEKAVPYFEKLAPVLSRNGVNIVNLSPRSRVGCWPRKHWSEVWKTLYVKTYLGFGDNMYSMPFVRRMARDYDRVFIETPFPQLYQEVPNALFVRPNVKLHSQAAAEEAWKDWCEVRPDDFTDIHSFYEITRKSGIESVPERFAEQTGFWDIDMSLDIQKAWVHQAIIKLPWSTKPNQKICVVKQPTFRKEWYTDTRNPKPEYLQSLVSRARGAGYLTVSVADIREGEEWYDGEPLDVDIKLHNKELDLFGVVGLIVLSDLVIAYPSFFLPLCLALKKRCVFVFGGCVLPSYFKSERLYNMENYRDITPSPFCQCGVMVHTEKQREPRCNKNLKIEWLDRAFDSLQRELQQAVAC